MKLVFERHMANVNRRRKERVGVPTSFGGREEARKRTLLVPVDMSVTLWLKISIGKSHDIDF